MPDNDEIRITPLDDRVLLRLKSWDSRLIDGSREAELTGRRLPAQVGAVLTGEARMLCVGPGEWLVSVDCARAAALREQVALEMPRQGLALVELTHGLAGLRMEGAAVRELLSKACGLDFHPRSFPVDRCARTRFAQVAVVVDHIDEMPRFELYVAQSYLTYLRSWLADAAVEFGSLPT